VVDSPHPNQVFLANTVALRSKIGDEIEKAVFVLRMYEVSLVEFNGLNANHWFDLEVGYRARDWYIHLWSDFGTYCAEIGLRHPSGTFYSLGRSNTVRTPRALASPRTEMIWMRVGSQGARKEAYADLKYTPYLNENEFQKTTREVGVFREERSRFYLREEDIRAYYARLFPLLKLAHMRFRSKWLRDAADGLRALNGNWEIDRSLISGLFDPELIRRLTPGSSGELASSSWFGKEKKNSG